MVTFSTVPDSLMTRRIRPVSKAPFRSGPVERHTGISCEIATGTVTVESSPL
jgi:hypothetical protein